MKTITLYGIEYQLMPIAVDALKAQINRLYEVLEKSNPDMRKIEQEIQELMSRTPKQCLAEVEATLRTDDGSRWCFEGDLSRLVKTLRE